MTTTTTKITGLRAVYPPIANSEASTLIKDPEVEARFRASDIYLIAGRAAARLINPEFFLDRGELTFDLVIGDSPRAPVRIVFRELPGVLAMAGDTFVPIFDDAGRGLQIWDRFPEEDGAQVVEWFTAEMLLWHRARGRSGIYGLDEVRELATYDLLYVGIAKDTDSFDRLFKQGHKARLRILSDEPQRYPGARVSDEIFLFLLTADSTVIRTFDLDHDFAEGDLTNLVDPKRVVADAEKAFVSLLQPEYNIEKFKQYPKGVDGLYNAGLARYGYTLLEEMTLNTAHGQFRGARGRDGGFSNAGDAIFVEGDSVQLFRSGVDFPADAPQEEPDEPTG